MNLRVVPAFAFTLKVILAPLFGAVTPESPGLSRFGGVFWPTPFSRYWNVGGAGLLGSAPCALPSVLQILQLLSCFAVFGRSFFLTTLKVCGQSCGWFRTTVTTPPARTV